jgi:hypothetical protein
MTDFQGRRYCYSNQPQAMQWNCIQLANALFSADLVEKEAAEEALSVYAEVSRLWPAGVGSGPASVMCDWAWLVDCRCSMEVCEAAGEVMRWSRLCAAAVWCGCAWLIDC